MVWGGGRRNSNLITTVIHYLLGFDDSSWAESASGFGYGDGDDATVLPNSTKSVYLRKVFEIADISEVSSLILDVDYDDAFVAYMSC